MQFFEYCSYLLQLKARTPSDACGRTGKQRCAQQTWRPAHTDAQKKKNLSSVGAIHAQAVRQRSKVFITTDVSIHNKKWWPNLLQSVLFKVDLLSPSCCSLPSVRRRRGGTVMINALSAEILEKRRRKKKKNNKWSFCWSVSPHVAVVLCCGARWKNNCIKIENRNRLAHRSSVLLWPPRWIQLMPVCSEHCLQLHRWFPVPAFNLNQSLSIK